MQRRERIRRRRAVAGIVTLAAAWGLWVPALADSKVIVSVSEGIKVGETIPTPCAGSGYYAPGFQTVQDGGPHDYNFFYESTAIGGDASDLFALNQSPGDGFPSGCINSSGQRGPFKITAPGTYTQTVQEDYGFVHCDHSECFPMDLGKSGSNASGSHNTAESMTVTYHAYVLNPIYSDLDRRKFQQDANIDALLGGGLGLIGPVACKSIPDPRAAAFCGGAVGGMVAGFIIDNFLKSQRASDPVDRHYRSLAKPVAVALPVRTSGLSAAMAAAERKLFPTLGAAIALDRAINTSLNRAQGAYLAHNRVWQQEQINQARRLSARVATVERPLAPRIKAFLAALGSLGSSAAPLTPDAMFSFDESILGSGPGDAVDAGLRALRASTEERTLGLLGLIGSPTPAGTTLSSLGGNPQIVPAINAGLAATAHFAHAGPTRQWRPRATRRTVTRPSST